jgi:hypothetical protein
MAEVFINVNIMVVKLTLERAGLDVKEWVQ